MKNLKHIFIAIISFGFSLSFVQAQNFDFGEEKVNLFTDRTLFITGEEINFNAYLDNVSNQSKALYIELILADGTSLVSQKHSIVNKNCRGKLVIPHDIVSGTYYIKAYTKYMRNFGAEFFSYSPLKIVNPNSLEFLSGEGIKVLDSVTITDVIHNKSLDETNIKIQLTAEAVQDLKNFIVSIVPAHSFQVSKFKNNSNSINRQKYYPETRGLSVTGLLVDSLSQQPIPFKEVTLSIIEQKNFLPTLTRADGKFYFALPDLTGNHDLFISTKKEESYRPLILVDKDYDTESISLPNPPFSLSKSERLAALKLAQAFQISANYFKSKTIHNFDTFRIPFYGHAKSILYLDKYISMATLEEYFTELPGIVHIKNQNKVKSFVISSPLRDMSFYRPLVLMDMVAVEDINRILAVSPIGVEKVEIIPHPYVYGSIIYGGIISIRSREGDFGGISLPKTGLFFNFDFLEAQNDQKPVAASQSPDCRNTLFWESFSSVSELPLEIEFQKESSNEIYWLIIQGLDANKNIERKVYVVN